MLKKIYSLNMVSYLKIKNINPVGLNHYEDDDKKTVFFLFEQDSKLDEAMRNYREPENDVDNIVKDFIMAYKESRNQVNEYKKNNF